MAVQPELSAGGRIRRSPVQERSTDTVQQILGAASALLERIPLEDLTTSRIAAEAHVSVGGLYRFFGDKQEIIDAIALRHVRDFESVLENLLQEADLSSGQEFLSRVIDAYVAFLNTRPDFRTIALGRHVSTSARQRGVGPDVGPAALVKQFIVNRVGLEVAPDLDIKLRVVSEVGERLIAFAYAQPTENERAMVIEELKQMLCLYLFK